MPQAIKWKNEACILLVDISKIMILRTCTSAHTKDRNIRERWHSKGEDPHHIEIWDDLTYLSICYHPSADLNSAVTVPVGPYRVKNSPTWCEGGANDVSLPSTQRMRRKVVFSPSLLIHWWEKCSPLSCRGRPLLPDPCILHKHPILINPLLTHHFVPHWIISVPRHKEPELH